MKEYQERGTSFVVIIVAKKGHFRFKYIHLYI